MNLIEIASDEQATDEEVRERAKTSKKAARTKHYIVCEDHCEVAFLSLDLIPDVDYLVLYEIFVPKRLRGRGIGTRLLTEVERVAKSNEYQRITLTPWPLDPDYPEEKLVSWYERCGFKERLDCPSELEKWIS